MTTTAFAYDLGTMGRLYAAHGVREFWMINAATLETNVHRDPSADGYRTALSRPATELPTSLLAPALEARLADLDLD